MRILLLVSVALLLSMDRLAFGAVPVHGFGANAEQTLAAWRSKAGRGPLREARRRTLMSMVRSAVTPTRATILGESVFGGKNGPAIYLDLASRDPVWTLGHSRALIRLVALRPFTGGWAIRLRDARRQTVWIAGHAGSEGFVGSATSAIDAASPVQHG